ncbi:pectate lyase [Filimonas effusa]|uniref:Pectate lyase n=1 Tax=Filimonas effusa TaxID=2508721 RepID=A0A4Q1D585_9BACT|nr:pectate lyase [Filimonas effusa]RXK82993.1 pectate lyase [Filimonas effusa]
MCNISAFKTLLLGSAFILTCSAQAQTKAVALDMSPFGDASRHWYGIPDKHNMIQPAPGHPQYASTDLDAIGQNILLYQKSNGGWPKNYDMLAILTPKQKDTLIANKSELNTTIDNGTSYTHVAALAQIYAVTKNNSYKEAAIKGLHYLLEAQYRNGGWPQYYPLEKNYSSHITYNDDAMAGVMFLFKSITDGDTLYNFLSSTQRNRIKSAFNKGIDCILNTQIREKGVATAWCQQHDEVTLAPAWARKFEPPSICNAESVKILQLLMSIKNPSPAIIKAVDQAVAWFRQSAIHGIRIETIQAPAANDGIFGKTLRTDRIVVADSTAPDIWTRYYELGTHRPLFCNRDSKVVYSLAEVERERRVGYAWYTDAPKKILDKYESWRQKNLL